jgi:hypothetical protein
MDSPEFEPPEVFVGIDVAYDDLNSIKMLVDEVKSYTNFFIVGSTGVTYNFDKLNEVCQYVYNCGLYFAVYFHINTSIPQSQWIKDARKKWGDLFLGLYAYDEAGGHQMDHGLGILVKEADNYTDATNKFVKQLNTHLEDIRGEPIFAGDSPLITSDYCLYWFDYKAGYDIVLCQFGWNNSRLLNIALCRGAASVQKKQWGVMITWTYNNPPYIGSGEEIYNDMILAYKSGAKYIVVFNYPKVSNYGILEDEHLMALKKFWQFIKNNPRKFDVKEKKIAYVLPKDYGYGFRGLNDRIWGLWEADNLSKKIVNEVNRLLDLYGLKLDLIYDDDLEYVSLYDELVFWNGTLLKKENIGILYMP